MAASSLLVAAVDHYDLKGVVVELLERCKHTADCVGRSLEHPATLRRSFQAVPAASRHLWPPPKSFRAIPLGERHPIALDVGCGWIRRAGDGLPRQPFGIDPTVGEHEIHEPQECAMQANQDPGAP
jgi:hypothetical protein